MWKNDELLPLGTTISHTDLTIWRCWIFLRSLEGHRATCSNESCAQARLEGCEMTEIATFREFLYVTICNGLPWKYDKYDKYDMFFFGWSIYLDWKRLKKAPDSLHSHRPPFWRHGDLTGSNSSLPKSTDSMNLHLRLSKSDSAMNLGWCLMFSQSSQELCFVSWCSMTFACLFALSSLNQEVQNHVNMFERCVVPFARMEKF